jgi:cytochrome c biogenesis protein
MLYIRERRVWVWLSRDGERTQARMALSSNRKTMETDREFARLKQSLLGVQE